jgi:pilus assembly protein CpaB
MKRRLITVVLFALVAALVSSTVLYRILSTQSAHASDGQGSHVYVAARDLRAGTMVSEADLRVATWSGPVNSHWIERREDLVGRGLTAAVNSGEPFSDNRMAAKGGGAGFAAKIPAGMRVVPVHIDDQSVLSHLIIPGMHVDVLSTGGQSGPNVTTKTILQNVKVLSQEEGAERSEKDKSTASQSVNLLVSPAQAEVLTQAIAQTRIQLVLRNPLDMAIAELFPKEDKVPVPVKKPSRPALTPSNPVISKKDAVVAPKPEPPTVEIVHGTKRTVTVVAANERQEAGQ